MFKFELGQKAKDTSTGVEGNITGRVDYLNQLNQYYISDESSSNNWSEEENVELISE